MASIPKFTRQELEKFILSSWDTSVAEYWRILSNDEIDFSERRMGICKLPRLVRISKAEVRAGVGVGLLLAEKAWGQVAQ